MRYVLASILALSIVAAAGAQPQYGDLVYCVGGTNPTSGFTGYFNPAVPTAITTLATAPKDFFHSGVRMAHDNLSLVVSQHSFATMRSDLMTLLAGGGQRTIAAGGGGKYVSLDHDGKWILVGVNRPSLNMNFLRGVDHRTGAVTTFWTKPRITAFEALAIDRDPGASLPYAIASWGTACSPRVLRVDRQGNTTTILNCSSTQYVCAALHPRSGDYMLGNWSPGALVRVTKAGVETTVASANQVNDVKITQDDFAWCAVQGTAGTSALKIDLSQNAIVTLVPTGEAGQAFGIEVYGSRPLVCCQLPATPRSVAVNVQSRHPRAAGATYHLAASFARRPGIKFANGQWLDLNAGDPLFYISALGLAPTIFTDFSGTLDAAGNAPATVNIPAAVPLTGTMAVFVAGVIMNNGAVIEVTNSHWFLL